MIYRYSHNFLADTGYIVLMDKRVGEVIGLYVEEN
jgi:hypothetical protein